MILLRVIVAQENCNEQKLYGFFVTLFAGIAIGLAVMWVGYPKLNKDNAGNGR